MKTLSLVALGLLLAVGGLSAAEVTWHPDANMDSQLFPAMIIATATQRPVDDEDAQPDPELLGDPYGAVGVSITAPTAKAKVQVTLQENAVMNKSTWSGVLETAGTEYYISPKVNYKFEQLRKARQQVPLNVTFAVEVDGKSAGEQTETITLRTVNDCPFGVADSEATIDEETQGDEEEGAAKSEEESNDGGGFTDMGWMFAAYVNENSPIVDKILKEALATGFVDHFGGYQGNEDDVLREVFAIWSALQGRGIKYSNITTTAGTSETVYSQHVRFVDESLANEQANCVDGSVLFASILRKIGLRTFLVSVPGHMFMGIYLQGEGDARVAIETTMLGSSPDEELDVDEIKGLEGVKEKLDDETLEGDSWKTFVPALVVGTQNLVKHNAEFEKGDNPQYQITDIDESRKDGIMPISYQKEE